MSIAAVAALVQTLRKHPLLEPEQLEEVRRTMLVTFDEPAALVEELVRRGWLTNYQADLLLRGRVADLVLGSYVLLEPLGEGGMGQVFKARQRKLGRIDAVKVLRAERLGSTDALRRFHREMVAVGQLSHPNVVHAFDAGEDNGRHYFAMELMSGEDLSRLVKRDGPLPFTTACEYARQAALGLQHAHECGLIHRDVKPSNLLLTADGFIKVLDLGLARLTRHAESSELTAAGAVMGTPDYIAPEQARQSHTVDSRADLYSLGCTLYFLLAGRPPFPTGSMASKVAAHLFEEPEGLTALRPGTPDSVAAVVRKLMAKKPDDRYPTAGDAAAALGRVMVELAQGAEAPTGTWTQPAWTPPSPSPPSARPRKVRRRPRPVVYAVAAAVVAAAVVILAAVGIARLAPPRLLSPPPPPAPPPPTTKGTLLLQCADPELYAVIHRKGESDPVGELGPSSFTLPPGDYELTLPSDAPPGFVLSPNAISLSPGGKQTVRVDGVPLAPWALVSRPAPIEGVQSWTITTSTGRGAVDHVGYSPDGRWLAATNEDGVVRLFDPTTGRLDRALIGHFTSIRALAWCPDKAHPLLATSDSHDVRVWEPMAGRLARTLPINSPALTWSPDGKTLACAVGTDVQLWDVDAGRLIRQWSGAIRPLNAVAWSPDGKTIAGGSDGGTFALWGLPDGRGPSFKLESAVYAVAWSPDGATVAVGCGDGTVRLWPADGSAPLPPLVARDSPIRAVAWSPDGRHLAALGDQANYVGRVFDVKTGTAAATLAGYTWGGHSAAWASDGATLAVGDWSRAVRFFDAFAGREVRRWDGHDDIPFHIAFSPDGTLLASDGQSNKAHTWNVQTGALVRTFIPGATTYVNGLVWAADGKRLAGSDANRAFLWDLDTPKMVDLGPNSGHWTMAWSPDGTLLAAAPFADAINLSRTDGTGEPVVLTVHKKPVAALAWASDGAALAAAAADGAVVLWERDVDVWKPRELGIRQKGVRAVRWTPDGQALATAGEDGTVCLWDRASGKCLRLLHISADVVRSMAWSDAHTLVTISNDGAERFWDEDTGDLKRTIRRGASYGVVFSSDASLNAAGAGAYTARLWDTDTGRPLGTVVLLHQGGLVLSDDGHYRGENAQVEEQLVYVVQTEDGQQTLAPADFAAKYAWKNDRAKARFDTR